MNDERPVTIDLDDFTCDRCGADTGGDLFTHPDDPRGYCEPCYVTVHKR